MVDINFSFLDEQIKLSNKPLVLTHEDPDGDAIGSLMAIKTIIEELGKKPTISVVGKITSEFEFVKKICSPSKIDVSEYDLIIILDTNNPHRTGIQIPKSLSRLPTTIIIDHHIKKIGQLYPPNFHLLINPKATATCEIIFDLIKESNLKISTPVASYLLLGIYTDSGGFFHSNTTPELLRKTRELLRKGVFFKNITQNALKGKSVKVLNFWGEKITQSNFHPKLKFIYSVLNNQELKEKNISSEEIGGLSNLLNMCEEARFSLSLLETENKVKGSLRSSEEKNIDVSTISRLLGGGGHRLAAGFEIPGKIVDNQGKIYLKLSSDSQKDSEKSS